MKTISSIVENYIKSKPFLQSALAQGIINLTSLSRNIKPEIEEQLGKDVRNGAIVMALKRLSSELEFRATHRILKVLKNKHFRNRKIKLSRVVSSVSLFRLHLGGHTETARINNYNTYKP